MYHLTCTPLCPQKHITPDVVVLRMRALFLKGCRKPEDLVEKKPRRSAHRCFNPVTPDMVGLYVLIGAGVLMMLVGFFGCCGAIRESQCLLGSFFACLLVIFTAEMTAGVFVFLGKSTAIEEFQNIYTEALDDYKNGVEGSNTTLLSFHKIVGCCGKDSVEDMKHLCPKDLKVHKNCLEEIEKLMSSKLKTVGIVCIAVAGVTIFGMIFSMVLCCAIRNSREIKKLKYATLVMDKTYFVYIFK
ncbi:hypothetical protein NDU88_005781 [Pleurodeles waltl]|uniref:Tetraspanin-2 n=1 Tax=Pleurodeles waltl TaxID=8319 RepID=A0AAV7QM05_PLEWA|nr:hypothetical protein NDU88_005781 [Pleurodeles waltl]